VLLSAVVAAATSSYGLLVKHAFDGLEASRWNTVALLPVLIVVAAVVKALALYGQTLVTNAAVQRALISLQQRLFDALVRADTARLATAQSGALSARFLNDVTVVREAALRLANNLARSVLTVIGCAGVMLWLDWALAAVLLVAYPIAFWPVIRLGERLRKASRRAQEQTGEVSAFLTETFHGQRTLKAYGLEAHAGARANAGFTERAKLYLKVLRTRAAVDPLLEVVGGLAFAGVLGFAGWRILSGAATTGDLVGFIAMLAAMAPEVRALGTLQSVVAEAAAGLERIYEEVDAHPTLTDPADPVQLGPVRGHVRLEDVQFRYPRAAEAEATNPAPPSLQGVSLDIPAGQFVALVGPSGAGKSSVFNLLLRLYDPDAGVVRLDGHDVRNLRLTDLRGAIALVSQDALLFDDTLAGNIALGRPGASRTEIEAAAARADVTTFAGTLPQGLDTPVGEGGRNLSGGQRQRVALARALLRQAPVLLLDEATSALDTATEARVMEAISAERGRRTCLVIAHRLSTIRNADRIVVFDAGGIVAEGTHAELMAAGGLYASLARGADVAG
jgi:subfamily B ATP-binding cassette protein MsbA